MIGQLYVALKSRFTSQLLATFAGGFWREEAPSKTTYPYVLAVTIAAPADSKYGGVFRIDPTIALMAVVKASATDPDEAGRLLFNAYNEHLPVLAAYGTCHNVICRQAPVSRLMGLAEDGQEVWSSEVIFEYAIRPA